MLTLTRRYPFSAAHRLWNPDMSDVENEAHFGPCTRLHGHNYLLDVTITGTPSSKTGMIMDILELDKVVYDTLLKYMDHYHLEEDVPFLKGQLTTVEYVVDICYKQLKPHIKTPARLYRLRLYESQDNWAEIIEPKEILL